MTSTTPTSSATTGTGGSPSPSSSDQGQQGSPPDPLPPSTPNTPPEGSPGARGGVVTEAPMWQYFKLSAMGKLFFASVFSGVMFGKKSPFKLRATPQQVKAVTNALIASKGFQDELKRPGATVDSVISKLNLRHLTAADFERQTGKPWPL